MLSNFIVVESLKIVQIMPILKRFLFAPFVVSQQRLNELWSPPQCSSARSTPPR